MSPSVGTGKTAWSSCSVKEMNNFVQQLGSIGRPSNCLIDTPSSLSLDMTTLTYPGQQFGLDAQCGIFHGDCWRHELKDGQKLDNVCEMIWCGSGEGIVRTAHPALEGTYCGKGKWCMGGKCINGPSKGLREISGAWSNWDDSPTGACASKCSQCEIFGQIKVRRSIRECNNPSPNNGGKYCSGDSTRGLRCDDTVCEEGPSASEYASGKCQEMRDKDVKNELQLSGKGYQYEQAPCKVWCHVKMGNVIRTVANYPDGTPCSRDRFCVKGECRRLLCDNMALVDEAINCPFVAGLSIVHNASATTTIFPTVMNSTIAPVSSTVQLSTVTSSATRTPITVPPLTTIAISTSTTRFWPSPSTTSRSNFDLPSTESAPSIPTWTEWGEWTLCIAPKCGMAGLRMRTRNCDIVSNTNMSELVQTCPGSPRHRAVCVNDCPVISQWSAWTACSTSCGVGFQQRRTEPCEKDADCSQRRTCEITECAPSDSWADWATWSGCSRSCGKGLQIRRRRCRDGFNCTGIDAQSRTCNGYNPTCESASSAWFGWSNWSPCSVSCGSGLMQRKRQCSGHDCIGQNSETALCYAGACTLIRSQRPASPVVWTVWSMWTSCSVSCGDGVMRRSRFCLNRTCNGSEHEVQTCNNSSCG